MTPGQGWKVWPLQGPPKKFGLIILDGWLRNFSEFITKLAFLKPIEVYIVKSKLFLFLKQSLAFFSYKHLATLRDTCTFIRLHMGIESFKRIKSYRLRNWTMSVSRHCTLCIIGPISVIWIMECIFNKQISLHTLLIEYIKTVVPFIAHIYKFICCTLKKWLSSETQKVSVYYLW